MFPGRYSEMSGLGERLCVYFEFWSFFLTLSRRIFEFASVSDIRKPDSGKWGQAVGAACSVGRHTKMM